MTGADLDPAGDELGLSPADHENYAADLARAGVTLARAALRIAGGDEDAAKALLRPALEAIGALPYEPAPGNYHYGKVP